MVEKRDNMDVICYVCEKCGMAYEDEKWAAECEAWCTEHPGT